MCSYLKNKLTCSVITNIHKLSKQGTTGSSTNEQFIKTKNVFVEEIFPLTMHTGITDDSRAKLTEARRVEKAS